MVRALDTYDALTAIAVIAHNAHAYNAYAAIKDCQDKKLYITILGAKKLYITIKQVFGIREERDHSQTDIFCPPDLRYPFG